MYGDDRKAYLHEFVEQILDYWNEKHQDSQIGPEEQQTIQDSINDELENFHLPGHRTEHRDRYWSVIDSNGLRDFETAIAKDMEWFLSLHCYELQMLLRVIGPLPQLNGHGIATFKDVIRIRRLQRERPKLSRIIEHPAEIDLDFAIESLEELVPPSGGGPTLPQGDAEKLSRKLQDFEDHKKSADRLIGTVWASSGLEKHQWRKGSTLPLDEDWALIKLFRNDDTRFQNGFQNFLRPDFPEQQFSGVMELPDPICIDITKRGTTMGLTAGSTAPNLSSTWNVA